jgi:hypothetical protein
MATLRIWIVLAGGLFASCATSSPSRPVASRTEFARRLTPQHLSETARALISDRMQTHGDDMTMLFWAMIFLDQEDTKRISEFLAGDPTFARPSPGGDSTINALLPEEFFRLQTAFADKAKTMAALANAEPPNRTELARAFGDLAATCVACHSVYLDEPASLDDRAAALDSYRSVTRVRQW